MEKAFRVYTDSAILNRALEFPVNIYLFGLRRIFYLHFRCLSIVKMTLRCLTRLYIINDVVKNLLAAK